MKKIIITVRQIIPIIKKGLTILTPVATPIMYPMISKNPKLNIRVTSRPKKSSLNLFDDLILGTILPIYKWVVNRDTSIVEISPIKEFKAGISIRVSG